ncbi:carbon-nitrogen hydrolase family protein [Clostridium sporogenes]|uniref:carbon-nitrogen hydrolase family protein n=1 Tax=Clostridium sporogenes TaxID=1509 RepID=UPI0006B27E5D|nr:carbon-nitrogen hydrolase family protein [Clostridium sporogenes]KOY65413.1 hypothetical protein AN649_13110 [Clostridium sporogenes]MDS1006657.1 carbon-nitrogen hydrolase family protein [Clostridium sporogenes]
MKIAISQLNQIPGNDQHRLDNNITNQLIMAVNKAVEHIRISGEKECDLICFPQWFVGLGVKEEIPNQITEKISQAAKKYNIKVITGTFRIPSDGLKSRQCSLFINENGEIKGCQEKKNLYALEIQWYDSNDEISYFDTSIGRIVISHGDDCLDLDVYQKVQKIKPDIWVLQANSLINPEKIIKSKESFKDAVCKRSQEIECTCAIPMMLGEFLHVNYTGGSFFVKDGNVMKSIEDEEELLIYED